MDFRWENNGFPSHLLVPAVFSWLTERQSVSNKESKIEDINVNPQVSIRAGSRGHEWMVQASQSGSMASPRVVQIQREPALRNDSRAGAARPDGIRNSSVVASSFAGSGAGRRRFAQQPRLVATSPAPAFRCTTSGCTGARATTRSGSCSGRRVAC